MLIWIILSFGTAPPADTLSVEQLIRSLGAEDFKIREDATRRLMRRPDAAPALQRALLVPDLEVRGRAGKILAALRAERAKEASRLAARLLRSGRLDLAAALLAEDEGFAQDPGCWGEVAASVTRLYHEELKRAGRPPLRGDLDGWLTRLTPAHEGVIEKAPRGRNAVISVTPWAASPDGTLVTVMHGALFSAAAGPSRRLSLTTSLAITAGGPSKYHQQLFRSIIVCGGDVTLSSLTSDCIVVARGRVRIEKPLAASSVLSHDEVTFARPNLTRPSDLPERRNVIREHQRGPLSGIRFFELDEFGLVMARGTDVARAVLPGVFRDAGLRPGDTIVSVGGEKASDAEQIRTLFMRHFLRPGPVYLKVKRAGETRTLYVNIPEPLKAP